MRSAHYCLSGMGGHVYIPDAVAQHLGLQEIADTSRSFPAGDCVYWSRRADVGSRHKVRFAPVTNISELQAAELITNVVLFFADGGQVPDSISLWSQMRDSPPSKLVLRLKYYCLGLCPQIREAAKEMATQLRIPTIHHVLDSCPDTSI